MIARRNILGDGPAHNNYIRTTLKSTGRGRAYHPCCVKLNGYRRPPGCLIIPVTELLRAISQTPQLFQVIVYLP